MPAPIPTRADHLLPGDTILSNLDNILQVVRVELDADVRLFLLRQPAAPGTEPTRVIRKPDAMLRRLA